MKKGKMFKKSISCLLAALMIIASMPFTAITAFAATGTLSNSGFTIVYNNSKNNSNTRWENNQFNIVNDQQYDNTSVGILKYNISALKGKTIDSATLNFSVDSFYGDGNGLVFYYSNRLSNVTLNNGSTGDSKLSYGEGTTANTGAASRYGFDINNVLTTVSRGDKASKSVDIASAVKSVLSSGSTEFYVFIMQKTAGGSGGNQITGATAGWTDTKIKPANVTINYSISNHIDNTKYSSKPATVFSPKKGTATVYWKESKDTSCSGAYNNLLYFNNYSEGISGTATANTGNNNCYTRAWYPTFVLLYDGVNDSYAPIMGSACKDDLFNSPRYLNYFVPMDSNNSSNLADSSNFYCDVWKGGEGSTLDYSWNSSQTHHEVRPSVTDNSGSTFGLAKKYHAHSSKLHIKDTITFEGNNGYSHAQNIYWFAGSHITQGIGAASGDKNFGQANKTTYVVNYEPLYDAANEAAKALQTFNQNDYTIASVNAYYDAINELYNFDPNTYFNGVSEDGVSVAVNSCAYAIKSAVDNYNNKKKALVKKATYTFVNINGTTVKSVKAENSTEALKEAPENSVSNSNPLNEKQHTKYTYAWPESPTGYVFTEKKEEVTENHDFRTLDTCTCGAKVDDASFEAAKKEADGILTQSSLYENTSFTNFMNTVSTLGSKRTNGELLCQKDFDNATFEILYAKTLLKKNQGTVTLTVYDVNGNEVSDAGDTFTGNYGDTVTVKPKNKCNIVKWVIETNTAKKELVGELPNIDLVVTGDTTVKAYCDNTATDTEHSYTKVIFKGSNGKVSAIKYVKVGEKLKTDTVEKPSLALYTIGEWNVSEVVGSADKAEVTVIAPCEPNTLYQCGIHFEGKEEDVIYKPYDTRIDINDFIQNDKVTYALATDKDGNNIIAYIDGTVFYVPARADVYVVTKDANAKTTMINTVGVYTTTRGTGENAKKTIGFNCKFSLAEGCKALEWGVVFIPIYNKAGGGTKIGTSTVAPIRSLSAQNEYTARINIPASSTSYNSIKAKAYLKYRDEAGNENITYGNENTQAFDPSTRFWEVK